MAEERRLESSVTADAVDRDSRAEALLVEGLDRYFGGKYDEAIHLWTRVLFFDRSHARARAYIDRARTALAERQRRTEELLHRAEEFLSGGQVEQARLFFAQAVAAGADDERVAEMRTRIERVDRARGYAGSATPVAVVDAVPLGRSSGVGASRSRGVLTAAAVVLALLTGALASPLIENWAGERGVSSSAPVSGASAPAVALTSSDVALVRARTLYSRGRLAEALRVLDRVETGSPQWPAADLLRVEIQQILLASRRGLSSPLLNLNAGRQ
jgi:hypothetical protein